MKSAAKISAVALIASLALAGCTIDAGAPAPAPAKASSSSAAGVSATPSPTAIPAPPKNTIAKFGETFTYQDGLSITVTGNGPSTASASAAGADETAGQIYLFTVEIVNGSDEVFDPALFRSDVNYGPDGLGAQRVFDTANGIGDQFQGRILPGKKQSVLMGYAIPADQLTDVLMVVSPSFNHTEQLFSSPLA